MCHRSRSRAKAGSSILERNSVFQVGRLYVIHLEACGQRDALLLRSTVQGLFYGIEGESRKQMLI